MMKKVFIIVFVSFIYSNAVFSFTLKHSFSIEGHNTGDDVFRAPADIQVGRKGNIYVLDSTHHKIKVFDRDYQYLYSIGGLGDGKENFKYPSSLAIDRHDNIYVADYGNYRIQIVGPKGSFLKAIDTSQLRGMINNLPVSCIPYCIFVDQSNHIYICNVLRDELLILDKEGKLKKIIGGKNNLIDVRAEAEGLNTDQIEKFIYERRREDGDFFGLSSIIITDSGNIVVADAGNSRVQIFDKEGNFIRKFGSEGEKDGQFKLDLVNYVRLADVTTDKLGNILVSDSGSNRVQVFDEKGNFIRKFGTGGERDGQFKFPGGIAVDGSGNILVADTGNQRIQVFDKKGNFITKFGEGSGKSWLVDGIAINGSGDILVAHEYENKVSVFNKEGELIRSFSTKHDTRDSYISSLTIDEKGDIFIADSKHNRILVFGSEGKLLYEIGKREKGKGEFHKPFDIKVNAEGNLVVSEYGNDRVQILSKQGKFIKEINYLRGLKSNLSKPSAVAIDELGNMLIVDNVSGTEANVLNKKGRVTILNNKGEFVGSFIEDGSEFDSIAVDKLGNIFVTDVENHQIKVFDKEGKERGVVGKLGSGVGEFHRPSKIVIDNMGKVFVADYGNNRIQVFSYEFEQPVQDTKGLEMGK